MDIHIPKDKEYWWRLVLECLTIASISLPVNLFVDSLHIPLVHQSFQRDASIFVSAVVAHLIQEFGGLNAYMSEHGAAAHKAFPMREATTRSPIDDFLERMDAQNRFQILY